MSISKTQVVASTALIFLIAGCGGTESSGDGADGPADTSRTDSARNKSASGLDTVPLASLLPAQNVHGLLFDYSSEVSDLPLDERDGALAGHAAHWDQPGEYSANGMVRVFRYRSPENARANRGADRVRPDMHATDTVLEGREAFFVLDTVLYEDGTVTVLAKIDHVDGSTEIEAFSEHQVPGLERGGSETFAEATADAVALFQTTLKAGTAGGHEVEREMKGQSPAQVARSEERARAVQKVVSRLESVRSDSLPLLSPREYIPKRVSGFARDESRRAPASELDAWEGSTSGWMSFWYEPDLPVNVVFHDLSIDVYRFESAEAARAELVGDMIKTGDVQVREHQGLPLMVVVEEGSNTTDVVLMYQQSEFGIRIHTARALTDGQPSPGPLVDEAVSVFSEVVRSTGRNRSGAR